MQDLYFYIEAVVGSEKTYYGPYLSLNEATSLYVDHIKDIHRTLYPNVKKPIFNLIEGFHTKECTLEVVNIRLKEE